MLKRSNGAVLLVVLGLCGVLTAPATAQIIDPVPQAMPFPVLAGVSFTIDPHSSVTAPLYTLSDGTLQLRANDAGWVDMEAYCTLPDRHWGPVSVVSGSIEVSGSPGHTGLAMPARVPLDHLTAGSTITLRLLMQAPLIILDLEGNAQAVMDTFLEEYHWTLVGGSTPLPVASAQ
jgi:hypothetical protein